MAESKTPLFKDPHAPVSRRVEDLLSRMTLEEKVAQTWAIWDQKCEISDKDGTFNPEKAAGFLSHGIGTICRPSENRSGGENLGPKENAVLSNAIQKFIIENTRLGIPVLIHEEGLHGQQAKGATNFPQAIALSGTWNPELVERVYAAVAREIRARGGQHVLTPVVDVAREPRWGRVEETFGEDPYLVAQMGVASVKGFQGKGPVIDEQHVAATMKHFAAHGQPENGTNCGPVNLSRRVIHEVFLYPFKKAVEAGVHAIMPSYNEIDGVPSHANGWLIDDLLRKEWGFEGIVVSDYFAIDQLKEIHHIVKDKRDAAKKALETGVDFEFPDIDCYATLQEQIESGRIAESALDKAVRRILRIKFLTGLFENPYVNADAVNGIVNCQAHQKLALEAAHQSAVLLKNENELLPWNERELENKTIAVIGPNAKDIHLGGYSDEPRVGISILEGIQTRFAGKAEVIYAEGCRLVEGYASWFEDAVVPVEPAVNARLLQEAAAAARQADVIVLAVGGNEQTCREAYHPDHLGDRTDLDLAGEQNALIDAVMAAGKPTASIVINGRPLAMNHLVETVPAIIEGWYLGQETGNAVANILLGDVNPGGKLTVTFPRSAGHLPVYYNKKPSANRGYVFSDKSPLFPFGFGLSYTTFQYDTPRLSEKEMLPCGKTTVSVDVTNTGSRAGDEVVQLYIRDRVSSVTRPVQELKGFQRIHLKPGETQTVSFTLGSEHLAFLDYRNEETVEPGDFDIMVGPSSAEYKTVVLTVVQDV